MAERFVSPGVFTRENDLSFLPQGIAEIGGAFIGPTVKGPAFVPTIVESGDEFRAKFGNPSPDFYAPHAALNYLGDAARATIVRVLGLGGYDPAEASPVILTAVSGALDTGSVTLGLLFPTRNTVGVTPVALASASIGAESGTTNFKLNLTNGNTTTSSLASMSIIETSTAYWVEALGTSPAGSEVGFALLNFPRANDHLGSITGSDWHVAVTTGTLGEQAFTFLGADFDYTHAETPGIQSQTVGGKTHNLFKIHTFSDGNASNREVKISIQSTRPATANAVDQHGQFSLVVRDFADTDSRQTVIEQFDNLSIDPDSPNFIARVIGDTFFTVDSTGDFTENGEFPSNSRNVYVEMVSTIASVPDPALPAGFAALRSPIDSTAGTTIPSASFVSTRFEIPVGASESVENSRIHYGWSYDDDTNLAYLSPIPSGSSIVGAPFSLEGLIGNDLGVAQAVISGTVTGGSTRKFTVPLQGGFDGLNPARVLATGDSIASTNTQGFDLSLSTTSGSAAYDRGIDVVSNPEAFDINLVVLPGVLRELHSFITQQTITMCEDRGDCFYIMDNVGFGSTVDTAVNTVASIDSNYVGTYHPWIKILDVTANKNI